MGSELLSAKLGVLRETHAQEARGLRSHLPESTHADLQQLRRRLEELRVPMTLLLAALTRIGSARNGMRGLLDARAAAAQSPRLELAEWLAALPARLSSAS